MGYDFRKQAGERDFADNFEREARTIMEKARVSIRKAGEKYLKVVDDLLGNFDLSLDVKSSKVWYYMAQDGRGNEQDRYSVRGYFVIKGDLPKEGIEGAIWDVTGGLKCKLVQQGNSWVAEFDLG